MANKKTTGFNEFDTGLSTSDFAASGKRLAARAAAHPEAAKFEALLKGENLEAMKSTYSDEVDQTQNKTTKKVKNDFEDGI
ncbi:MAG: hypothetical protein ACK4NC_06820 [Candidatus Gracilibacteria bacterium]